LMEQFGFQKVLLRPGIYLRLEDVRIFAEWRARQIGDLRRELKSALKYQHYWRSRMREIGDLQNQQEATKRNLIDTLMKRNAEYQYLQKRYDELAAKHGEN
jgi:hypothetical protein